MDSQDDSQRTQQATQNALDPRRIGKQNSGFSDEDISDIVCLLYPNSENASREIHRIAVSSEYTPHITGRYTADAIESDLYHEDGAREFGRTRGIGDHAIILKLSAPVKSPTLGFTFGRNAARCDICFVNDEYRRLSNIHFRIFVNSHGVVMLEDQSTNGTIVDDVLLKKRDNRPGYTMRLLSSGSTIKIFMHENAQDLAFIVRIPRREGELDMAFKRNLHTYLRRFQKQEDLDRTIGPGPSGHVNLFPPPFRKANQTPSELDVTTQAYTPEEPISREFRGGEKYNRVGVIGHGAFATVYKVASKYTGMPYAAKELDKRKFMKNGILDQKVENEMKIMQKVQHANIVKYVEHFDWGQHQFIIIMEYVPEGDLGKLVLENGAISEPYVKIMARQLIDALGYLHENRITHRDVKPDNILIHSTSPDLVVKLTDFGLSKMIDTEQTFLKTFCGTLLYCAPEVYSEFSTYDESGRRIRPRDRRQMNRERYDHAVDVWSLGGVLFYALTGFPPFPAKNGITYTELLHHIMTNPLNIQPLMKEKVSGQGINFLTRMIDRRPETRATIAELLDHPWLTSSTDSFDEISDDGLEQRASQLSLTHGQQHGQRTDDMGNSELMALEPEPDLSMDFGDDKENHTFGEPQRNRLWGEVSAIGSSMAINEERLNIPMSTTSFGETQIQDPEILDSFESEESSVPHQPRSQQTGGGVASSSSTTNGNARSVALGIGSQSLGGASSILENLNMKSGAHNSNARSEISDLNKSKRKPAYDTSDEYEMPGANLKPSFKRLKSKGDANPGEPEDEYSLIASVPPVINSDPSRQVDYPLHKTTFWDAGDKETWHLNYPEMTHSQYTAFKAGAQKRNEDFSEGKTALWDIAMEWFPPTSNKLDPVGPVLEPRPFLRRDSRSLDSGSDWDLPPTAPLPEDDQDSVPDTLAPESQIPVSAPSVASSKRIIARLTSSTGSLVRGIAIPITDPILSWGRARENTAIHPHPMEMKIPKYAFKILLWREGYTASANEFRPWERGRSPGITTMRASPEPESYAFYISTKATNGLRINNSRLPPNEPKDLAAPSKYWMKLHTGDTIVCWGTEDVNNQTRLDFECFWGGSSVLRPADDTPAYVPEAVARKLDSTWAKAEKNLHHDRIKGKATQEHLYRMKNMAREKQRSQKFEIKRAEAVRILAERAAAHSSPMSAAPAARGRTVPRFRQGSPAELATR